MVRGVLLAVLACCSCDPLLAQPTTPPVYLDHITISVTRDTFERIAQSPFVTHEFAAAEQRVNVLDGGKRDYLGFYLYGQSTYLEFVPASNDDPPGNIGFGLSVDDRAQLAALRSVLETKAGMPVDLQRGTTRRMETHDVPWFDRIVGKWFADSPVSLWVMAYYREYVTELNPAFEFASLAPTRQNCLAHFYDPQRYLRNVKRIAMWQSEGDINRMVQLLTSLGYSLSFDGRVQILRGPDFQFTFVPLEPGQKPKYEIDFDLNRSYTGLLSYRFPDQSNLVFFSRIARWSFPGRLKPLLPGEHLPEK